MKKIKLFNKIIMGAVLLFVTPFTLMAQDNKVPVFIVAGQSNADGRVPVYDLPSYANYSNCQWCYDDGSNFRDGAFETYSPHTLVAGDTERFGFDAYTYYYLEQSLQRPFYVVKLTLGGTAIDPSCVNTNNGKFWSCDPEWYAANTAVADGGVSLMKSFEKSFDACLNNTFKNFPEGYDIKAIIWHQGESDYMYDGPANYYNNFTTLISHMRNFIATETGNDSYKALPFIYGTISETSAQYNVHVDEAQRKVATEDPNAYLIDMASVPLQKDNLHFETTGAEYLGVKVFKKLVDLGVAKDVKTQLDHEVTDQLLVNPDFEQYLDETSGEVLSNPRGIIVRGIPYGWESDGNLIGNSYGINSDAVNFHGNNVCWINSTPMPDAFTLSQTIPTEKVEPGTYKVTCKLWVEVAKKGNCRLFANNEVQYYGGESDYTNLLDSEENPTYGGFGGGSTNNVILRNLSVTVKIEEGEDLTLGIKTSNRMNNGSVAVNNSGWFKIDQFRIYKLDDESTGINNAKVDVKNAPKGVYTIDGKLVSESEKSNNNLKKGLYIKEGKKVFLK